MPEDLTPSERGQPENYREMKEKADNLDRFVDFMKNKIKISNTRQKRMKNNLSLKILVNSTIFYRQYVDDCFLIFTLHDHVTPFLSYLNSKHPNIQFTHELESNLCLPFLDAKVIRSNGSFATTVHHKSTSTGLFTNFDSFIPMLYKKGLLFSLISRYLNICSSYVFFHFEMEKFKKTFSLNGYPATLVDSCIKSFLDKMYNSRDKVHTCSKKVIYFCLPFTGHHGLQIRSKLKKFLSSAYPHISLCVPNFFPFKDKIPRELRWCICISVNAVVHCMLVKLADTYTRISQNTWMFHP
jgi:hypothetical protein